MFCARLFICALLSPAGKGLTSWLSFVVSSVSLSLSHWYPGSGVVLDCIDSWSLHHYLLLFHNWFWKFKVPRNFGNWKYPMRVHSWVRTEGVDLLLDLHAGNNYYETSISFQKSWRSFNLIIICIHAHCMLQFWTSRACPFTMVRSSEI